MISFVWSSRYPFLAGAGGSENYTAGQIRELMRRGIECRIITIGFGEEDGRENFPDIAFTAFKSKEQLAELDDTIVFITYPLDVKTKHQSYAIMHCPPLAHGDEDPLFDYNGVTGKRLITPSRFAAKLWAKKLGRSYLRMPSAYPFAEPCFAEVERPKKKGDKTRILFAGRLTADKGIYTLLAALHLRDLMDEPIEITATSAGEHTQDGATIKALLEAHPLVNVVSPRRTPESMAKLVAEHDIVVMPSTNIFWKEAFGIVSVEAQHAGCRVVASRAGGLPETDCGGLLTVAPDNPLALAKGLKKAIALGPLTDQERARASTKFTVQKSVDQLLRIITPQPRTALPHVGPVRLGDLSPQLGLFGGRLKQPVYAAQRYADGRRLAHPKS